MIIDPVERTLTQPIVTVERASQATVGLAPTYAQALRVKTSKIQNNARIYGCYDVFFQLLT